MSRNLYWNKLVKALLTLCEFEEDLIGVKSRLLYRNIRLHTILPFVAASLIFFSSQNYDTNKQINI